MKFIVLTVGLVMHVRFQIFNYAQRNVIIMEDVWMDFVNVIQDIVVLTVMYGMWSMVPVKNMVEVSTRHIIVLHNISKTDLKVYCSYVCADNMDCVCDKISSSDAAFEGQSWLKDGCDWLSCPGDCSGHGECDKEGICHCDPEWGGDACNFKACPNECTYHSRCEEGKVF